MEFCIATRTMLLWLANRIAMRMILLKALAIDGALCLISNHQKQRLKFMLPSGWQVVAPDVNLVNN